MVFHAYRDEIGGRYVKLLEVDWNKDNFIRVEERMCYDIYMYLFELDRKYAQKYTDDPAIIITKEDVLELRKATKDFVAFIRG
jgi:hypothetical protein